MEKLDVLIIGGGVLGCFAARELSRYKLDIALVEAREDVCTGISRANTAIVYSAYDTAPGTLKTEMCLRANEGFEELCRDNERRVVNDPAPAINGNTIGTNTLELLGVSSVLKIFIPNIISKASANITNEPATAKDAISTLNKFNNASPTNKNVTNAANEYSEAFVAFIGLPCRL